VLVASANCLAYHSIYLSSLAHVYAARQRPLSACTQLAGLHLAAHTQSATGTGHTQAEAGWTTVLDKAGIMPAPGFSLAESMGDPMQVSDQGESHMLQILTLLPLRHHQRLPVSNSNCMSVSPHQQALLS
jgi:hypothetical protein